MTLLSAIPTVLFATTPGSHPVVGVDTSAMSARALPEGESLRLRGALLVRLVEEGYRVAAGTGNVPIRLTVRPRDAGWSVEARGVGVRDYHVGSAPLAVQSLEILQRATMALDSVEEDPAAKPAAPGLSVAIAVSAAAGDPEASPLLEGLAIELVDAGMVLTPRWLPHDRVLCVTLGESTISITAGEKGPNCTGPTSEVPRGARSGAELASAVSTRAAAVLAGASHVAADADPDVPDRTIGAVDSAPKGVRIDHQANRTGAAPGAAWRFGAWAGAGVLARSGGTDPLATVKIDLSTPSHFGGRLQGGLDWSNGPPPLSIFEWQALIGPTWSVSFAPSTAFTTGVLAGVLVHTYDYDPVDNGSRFDWDFAAPLELSQRWGPVTLGIELLGGVSGPPRDHAISGTPAWHRGSVYLGATAGLGVAL